MLTIWTNAHLPPETDTRLIQSVAPNKIVYSPQRTGNLSASVPDPLLAQADIAFGQPDPTQLLSLEKLKWIQLTTAAPSSPLPPPSSTSPAPSTSSLSCSPTPAHFPTPSPTSSAPTPGPSKISARVPDSSPINPRSC